MKGKPFLCTFCSSPSIFSAFKHTLPKGTSLDRTDFAPGRPGVFKEVAAVWAGRMCVFFLSYLPLALSHTSSSLTPHPSKSPLDSKYNR